MNITLNDVDFRYELDGPEGAPWIVFSNSLTTDVTMWNTEVAELSDRYRILRYDTRGHGQTSAPDGPYSFELLVADVIALMDAVGADRAHYVGLSLGGMTGLGVAIEHGDRLLSLAACDARPFADPEWAEPWVGRIALAREKGMEALVEPTVARWFTEGFQSDPVNAPVLDHVRRMIRETSVEGYTGCAGALQELNYLPRLGEISVPSLFMTGRSDGSTPPAASEQMHAAVPGSQCVIVDPASHVSNLENPAQFDAALFAHIEAAQNG
jgi:3-oxoadipate enol-lactonase